MRRLRVLLPLLAALLVPGAASAAPADPYVVYTANNYADGAVILRTDPVAGSLVEISRNGPQGTLFQRPFDLALEADGDILVADMGTTCVPTAPRCPDDGRIIRVDPVTGRQTLLASGSPLLDPAGIVVAPDGSIYVADNFAADDNGAVIRVDPATGAKTIVTEGENLDLPFGILVDQDGSLVVSNRMSPGYECAGAPGRLVRVQVADGSQQVITEGGLFRYPLGVALDRQGRIAFANECGPNGLLRLSSGLLSPITSNSDTDVLVTPERLVLDPAGDFLVSDFSAADGDGGIVKVDAETGAQGLLRQGELFNHPLGIDAVVNRPPRAVLRVAPRAAAAGQGVRLDASRSSDPERLRLVYEWDLDGDGEFEAGSGTTPAVTRSWTRDGLVAVGVRVNDPHGGRAVASGFVRVDGSTPIITGVRVKPRVIGQRRGRGTKRLARAARLVFNLTEDARVRVDLERIVTGRRPRRGQACSSRAKRGPRCKRFKPARVLTVAGRAGRNSIKIRARRLKPGRYRLELGAADAVGNDATPRTAGLRVVR